MHACKAPKYYEGLKLNFWNAKKRAFYFSQHFCFWILPWSVAKGLIDKSQVEFALLNNMCKLWVQCYPRLVVYLPSGQLVYLTITMEGFLLEWCTYMYEPLRMDNDHVWRNWYYLHACDECWVFDLHAQRITTVSHFMYTLTCMPGVHAQGAKDYY